MKKLYNEDETFNKEISLVKQKFLNLFDETDPNHRLVNQDEPYVSISPIKKPNKFGQTFFTSTGISKPLNPYE